MTKYFLLVDKKVVAYWVSEEPKDIFDVNKTWQNKIEDIEKTDIEIASKLKGCWIAQLDNVYVMPTYWDDFKTTQVIQRGVIDNIASRFDDQTIPEVQAYERAVIEEVMARRLQKEITKCIDGYQDERRDMTLDEVETMLGFKVRIVS